MALSLEDKIRNLKRKRQSFKLGLQAFEKMLETYDSDTQSPDHLQGSFEDIVSEYSTFKKVQPELDIADEDGEYLRERIEIKLEYLRCRVLARSRLL
ncbi:hypothetical protein WN51_03108 [Melipona quadrifasciata]|uniref:Uncharacterized protein n=1 Tax=Melipona quadrifasciata TaxID=166423 RepID=A0A0N0BF38_9HYME|nr:hypothetical protein WN51_03108 [Melipona quadrifasciata]